MLKRIYNSHIIMSGIYKGISGLSLFLSIKILIDYLGKEDYGIWVLIFTLFQAVLLMDFGIQSSLKTIIPLYLSENKKEQITAYIKQSYVFSIYIASTVFIVFWILSLLFNFKEIFNINYSYTFVNSFFLLNVFFFCLNFVANIQKSLYVAFFKGKFAEASIAVNQFGFFILVYVLYKLNLNLSNTEKLIAISLLNGMFCFIVNFAYTVRFFKLEKIKLFIKNKIKTNSRQNLLLGLKFMITQLGVVFIFSSDTYIISNAFGPEKIAAYEVVNKLFQFPFLILFAAISPLWAVFAKEYAQKNKNQLKSIFKKFNIYFVFIILGLFVLAYLTPIIIKIWINQPMQIPSYLILLTTVLTIFRIWVSFYTFFLNGIGNLNLYIILLLISVLLKIPLSYYLVNVGTGINSVLISSIFLMLFWAIILPLKSYKLVKDL